MSEAIIIDLILNGKPAKLELKDVDKLMNAIYGGSNRVTDSMSKWGNVVTGFNQGLEATKKLFNVISQPLKDAGQFEQYEAQLRVMLGSASLAKKRLQELVEFAATTPFELPEVVDLGLKLQSIGKYSKEMMRDLGDLAAASGKSIEQVFNAYAKLATGQIGEAKNMFRDVLISDDDWKKALNEKGLAATAENMMQVFSDVISQKGFSGMMDEQSKTLNGMVSNFQDALGQLSTEAGEKILPIAKDILDILIPAINGVRENMDDIIPIIKTVALITAAWTVAIYGAEAALKAKAIATALASNATAIFNKVLAANPILLVVAGLVTAIALLDQFTSVLDTSTDKLKDNIKQQQKEISSRRELLDEQIKNIETRKKEAIGLGESTEELRKYDDKIQELIKSKKELARTESLLKIQETAVTYAESLTDNLMNLWGWTEKLGFELDTTEKRLANSQMSIMMDQTRSLESRLLYVDELLKKASGREVVYLTNYKTALLAMQTLEIETSIESNKATGKRVETVSLLKDEIKNLTLELEATALTDKKRIAYLQQEITLRKEKVNLITSGTKAGKPDKTEKVSFDIEPLDDSDITGINEGVMQRIAASQKLNQAKVDFFNQEKERNQELAFQNELKLDSGDELINREIEALLTRSSILDDLRNAETEADYQKYLHDLELHEQKMALIEAEEQAREQKALAGVQAGQAEYRGLENIHKSIMALVVKTIKAYAAEAAAAEIKKVIATAMIPFPFDVILAGAAGLAVEAMFDPLMPKFERGAVNIGGLRHSQGGVLAEIEQGESVINRTGTRNNAGLLSKMNQGAIYNELSPGMVMAMERSFSGGASFPTEGFDKIVGAINNQTNRLEALERRIDFNYDGFDSGYDNFKKKRDYTG